MKTRLSASAVSALIPALVGVLMFAGTHIAQAVTFKTWTKASFFGSTKAEVHKQLGKPDDAEGMDSYLISDSPDLMMLGLIQYEDNKVNMVSSVLQPKISYKKIKEIQMKSEEVKFISENKKGALFKYLKPAPNGPNYLAISAPDDKATGPMMTDSLTNPFGDEPEKSAKPAEGSKKKAPGTKTSKDKPHIDLSLLDKDEFDWRMLDDEGKLDLLKKVKRLWRATGAETDKNDIDAKVLLEKITFPEQSMVVDRACLAAGIDPAPLRNMRNKRDGSSSGK